MGNTISAARAEAEKLGENEKIKQQQALDFLEKMLSAKMSTFENNLLHPAEDIHKVVVGTVVDSVVEFQINISTKPGQAAEVDTCHLYSHLLIR